uniref:Uncharacterized protein n=1 Tax=viral metagenome TaxID=1070528 RepID=A0A6C0C2B0_9ZZZZ
MTVSVCLIGATTELEYAQCSTALRRSWLEHQQDLHLKIMRVPCANETPGWKGCWACHRMAAELAVSHQWPIYLFLESKARPAIRFDWQQVLRIAAYLEQNPNRLVVNLSILPWPFKGRPRKKLTRDIYENHTAQMNGTTALLCTTTFGERLLAMQPVLPIDLQLANARISQLIAYPAPFQRNAAASTTTPPLLFARHLRSPLGYFITEEIDARPMHALLIALLVIVGAVVVAWGARRYTTRRATA